MRYENKNNQNIFNICGFSCDIINFRDKNVAYAKQDEEEKSVEDGTDEVLEKLDLERLEDYYSSLSDDESAFVAGGFKELLKRLIDGNVGVSFKDFIGEIFSLILKGALGFLPSIITVVVISVMSGMLKGLNSGFLNENTSESWILRAFRRFLRSLYRKRRIC